MSYCRKDGKDEIIFITKDDFGSETPSAADNPLMPAGDEPGAVGLIKENGEINWDCPCLQGMGNGPCGQEFKDAFACFHYSEAEPKGVDCLEQFKGMQECFVKHPEIYGSLDDDIDEEQKVTESESITTETVPGTEVVIQSESKIIDDEYDRAARVPDVD